MKTQAEQFERARYALKHAGPLTPAEKAEYDAQRAREMRRADARRNPLPQPDLLDQAA
ncbi:hypothetical protein [Lysobacter sp. F6437]|uniref:hypothetical protein n=1 Tax=Lysobacter sp. F6437 TaxID=3459296 RepID=UPI00403DC72B